MVKIRSNAVDTWTGLLIDLIYNFDITNINKGPGGSTS
jgi:hypothetical protein